MAQLVRAPPCHGGGRGFESLLGRLYRKVRALNSVNGVLAQLGEHLPYKQRVIGSSPIGPTNLDKLILFLILGRFPSGQRGQTVNLLQIASVVRIHLCPFGVSHDEEVILSQYNFIARGGAVWKLVGLITRRS